MTTLAAPRAPQDQCILLSNISWQTYESLLEDLGDCPIHLTYDRGRLEIMTLSYRHEKSTGLIGRLIEALTEELDIPAASAGSTTFKREDLERGLEPDRCFYIEHEAVVRDKDELDLTVDPPPDLAVEVDVTHSSLNRLSIYAALGVPEVWRFDGKRLQVYQLKANGAYEETPQSLVFPFLPIDRFVEFVNKRNEMDHTSLVKAFRTWVRQEILPKYK